MGGIIRQQQQEMKQEENKQKIVMIGLEQSGKSCLLQYLKTNQFVNTQPTVGLNLETISYQQRTFLIFDLGGKVKSIWSHYYDNLDAIIFVVDARDKSKQYCIRDEIINLNQHLQYLNVVVLVYFSKWDLIEDTNIYSTMIEETAIYQNLESDVIIQTCSSKTGEGVWEGFIKLNQVLDNHRKEK